MEIKKIMQARRLIELAAFIVIALSVFNALRVTGFVREIFLRKHAFKIYYLMDFRSLNDKCLGNGCIRNIDSITI